MSTICSGEDSSKYTDGILSGIHVWVMRINSQTQTMHHRCLGCGMVIEWDELRGVDSHQPIEHILNAIAAKRAN
jgi:hypothetical protein